MWRITSLVLSLLCLLAAPNIGAASEESFDLHIPAASAEVAVKNLSRQTGYAVIFRSQEVTAVRTNPVTGRYSVQQALDALFEGTPLTGGLTGRGVITVTHLDAHQNTGKRNDKMKTKDSILAAVMGLLFGAGGVQGALAQEEGEKNAGQFSSVIEEIIVTAQKREQRLIDVPMSVVAIGARDIDDRNINDFSDLAVSVPGISISDGGDAYGRRVFMRGVGNFVGGASSLIGIYMDEAPLTSHPVWQLDVRAIDLERVEVLRGPQGTLYGQGAAGGTIRFITKDPVLDEYSIEINTGVSNTTGGNANAEIETIVNAPLIEDRLALRLVGSYEHKSGWIDQPAAGKEDINGSDLYDLRGKLLWNASDALEVTALVNVRRTDREATGLGEDKNGEFTNVFGLTTTPSSEDEFNIFNLTAEYDFGGISLLNSTTYIDTDKSALGATSIYFGILEYQADFYLQTEVFSNELRLSSDDDGPFRWTIGTFFQDAEFNRQNYERYGSPGVEFFYTEDLISKSWSAFADVSIDLLERFEVGGGIRYFEDDAGRRSTGDFGNSTQEETFDTVSPRFYIRYAVADDTSLYVSAAKGFRSGGFNASSAQPSFGPETLWTYEGGVKAGLFDGAVNTELAVYYTEIKGYQALGFSENNVFTSAITNEGNADIKGVDVLLSYRITDALTVEFNGSFVDTEFLEPSKGVIATAYGVGDPLSFVSEKQFTLSALYDFSLMGRSGQARLDYNEQGPSTYTNRELGVIAFESDEANMLNFNIDWDFAEDKRVALFGANLLNDRGLTSPFAYFSASTRLTPRTIGLKFSIDL